MKKLLLFIALVGTMMLGSCSSDELVGNGKTAQVTFSAQLPKNINSRSFSDGTSATKLTCYIYIKTGENAYTYVTKEEATVVDLEAEISVSLVEGETYAAVFWAQAGEDAPFTLKPEDGIVEMNYSADEANLENRDAFYYREEDFTVEGSSNTEITLTRPFAQLNIGASDIAVAKKAGCDYTTAKVKASTYSALNLLTGTATGEIQEVEFAASAFPQGETFPVVEDGVTYTYLSMDYLLINNKQELIDVDLTLYPSADSPSQTTKEYTYTQVPVQRNYRTNIYGDLVTNPASYKVTIDQKYIADYLYKYTYTNPAPGISVFEKKDAEGEIVKVLQLDESETALGDAVDMINNEADEGNTESASIVMPENATIDLSNQEISLNTTASVEIDLNGSNLTIDNSQNNTDGILVTDGCQLTLTNGEYTLENEQYNEAVFVYGTNTEQTTSVTLENVTINFVNNGNYNVSAVHAYSKSGCEAEVNIGQGVVINVSNESNVCGVNMDPGTTLNMEDGIINVTTTGNPTGSEYGITANGVTIQNTAVFNMSGGVINIISECFSCGIELGVTSFNLSGPIFNMTGGEINVLNKSGVGTALGYSFNATRKSTTNLIGGTINVNASEEGKGYCFYAGETPYNANSPAIIIGKDFVINIADNDLNKFQNDKLENSEYANITDNRVIAE